MNEAMLRSIAVARRVTLVETPRQVAQATYKVRTVARFDALTARGGGEIQQVSTAHALRELGVDAGPWRPWEETLASGDVLHLFGSRPEFLPIVNAARAQGAKVALSTISWFDWKNILREPLSPARRAAAAIRYAARAVLPSLPSWRRELYHAADVLLPNSQAEADQLVRLFEIPASKIRVVPNGVEERFAAAKPTAFFEKFGLRDFVFCPGRIEPRKNQLELVIALSGSQHTLVIAGDVVAGCEEYAARCREAAGANVHFIGRLEHRDPLLASAYAASACVALVGWYETPGLAALEGAATGAALVVPQGGSASEYFGPWAEYVSPGRPQQLRAAVEAALQRPRSRELAMLVTQHFSWRQAALTTKEAYASLF